MKEIRTKLFSCNNISKSGRVYPKGVIEKAIEDFNEKHTFGLLCCPEVKEPSILESVGTVDEIEFKPNGDVFGKVLLLDNIPGQAYQNILNSSKDVSIRVTPVGQGNIDEDGVVRNMNITHFNIDFMNKKQEEKNTAIIPSLEYLKNVTIKFKKLDENAVIPTYAHDGDVGMDMTAIDVEYNVDKDFYIYHTGLALESDYGYGTFLFPRSSNCKTEAYLTNHVGIADSAIYRGEIQFRYKNRDRYRKSFWEWITGKVNVERALKKAPFNVGDRVGQMVVLPYPQVHIQVVDELSETERGAGGFGSTGK